MKKFEIVNGEIITVINPNCCKFDEKTALCNYYKDIHNNKALCMDVNYKCEWEGGEN